MANPSKAKGTRFEAGVVRYLSHHMGEGIERRTLSGAYDRGDVSGVYAHGMPVVVECKATRSPSYAQFLREAEAERGNADALAGIVVWKRPGVTCDSRAPLSLMGDQLVMMSLADLVALVTGVRPGDGE